MKKIIITTTIILLSLLSFFIFFTSTEKGTRTGLNCLSKLFPGQFIFQQVEGSLTQGLFIQQLEWHHKNYAFHANNLKMHLDFPFTVHIDQLELKEFILHSPNFKQALPLTIKAVISLNGAYLQFFNSKSVLNLQSKRTAHGFILTSIPDTFFKPSSRIDLSKNIQIKANIQQRPFFSWQSAVVGKQLNIANLAPSLSGNIDFKWVALGNDRGSVIQLQHLSGNVQGKKISGTMHSAQNKNDFNISSKLQWGNLKLFVQGGATEKWNLSWQLFFPNIHDLFQSSSGTIQSQGKLYGQRYSPHLTTQSNMRDITLYGYEIEKLLANVDLDLSENGIFKIYLHANNLHYKHYYFDHFILKGDGNTNQHTLEAQLKEGQQTFTTLLKGSYTHKIWREDLLKMDLLSALAGNWHLKKSASIVVSSESAHIEPILWQSSSATVNGQLDWQRYTNLTAKLGIHSLPISALRALLPDENLFHKPYGNIEADIQLYTRNKTGKSNKQSKAIPHNDFGLKGFIKLQKASFEIPNDGLVFKKIDFSAQANETTLKYTGSVESTEGLLNINGKTDFNASEPVSNISIQGNHFLIYDKPALSLYISPNLTVNLKKDRIDINGKIVIPKANLTSVKSLSSQVKLDPDVVFVDVLNKKNNSLPPLKKTPSLKINSKIRIILSDHVNFDLEGFKGRLIGHLDTEDNPQHLNQLNGKIQIVEGTYTIYGQTLTVSQGQLIFINSPIDNPLIHIQAVKKFNASDSTEAENLQSEITVGLNVDGNLKKPQTTLFSDPPGKSQKDILSLLMFERTTDEITNGENNASVLIKAASALNFGSHDNNLNQLISQMQHSLGLNELGLKTETTFNESSSNPTHQNTSFVLGKFISSRLYLKYSIGLLDAINTFTMRYLLGKKFLLQGQTNQQGTGVDLIYTIQR